MIVVPFTTQAAWISRLNFTVLILHLTNQKTGTKKTAPALKPEAAFKMKYTEIYFSRSMRLVSVNSPAVSL